MPGKKKLFRCGICQKEAVWDKYKQGRHVKTHTGAAHPLPEGTRDVGRSERYRDNERSMKQLLGSVEDSAEFTEIVKRVQDLKHSGPPGFRYIGGRFEAGLLQDKGYHEGMPEFFSEQGRLRQRFEWIMTYPVDRRVSTRRQSYSNRRWTDRSEKESEFTHMSTNLWTPGKYASWVCPDGSDGNREDPTLVGKLERQCDLCDGTQLCDCIQSRV
ncbi:hypothetical protein CEP51_014427 [Fusarium floridanum]|uniref:Uncharacterized protein n=1 Tax=Fusarium floridanum TaxID=1325733 RepID=A0A428PT57_9HYPO|nr:hypothetical protein CEP51_014427 [Fusarium floridanum]